MIKAVIFDCFGVLVGQEWNEELLRYMRVNLEGKYKLGLLSNVATGGAVDELGIFDDIVLSGEVGLQKPDPRIYELAVERLGVSLEECVFVDDSVGNVDVAESLGMRGIVYEDFEGFVKEFERIIGNE